MGYSAISSSGRTSGAGNAPNDSTPASDFDFAVPLGFAAVNLSCNDFPVKPTSAAWLVGAYVSLVCSHRFAAFETLFRGMVAGNQHLETSRNDQEDESKSLKVLQEEIRKEVCLNLI